MNEIMESYASHMKRVTPMRSACMRLMAELERERSATAISAGRDSLAVRSDCHLRNIPTRLAAFAIAAAFAMLLFGLLGFNLAISPVGSVELAGPVPSAYARGVKLDDGSVLLPAGFGSSIDWSQDDNGDYYASVSMDLALEGNGWRDITYSVEGEGVGFRFLQRRDSVSRIGEAVEFQDAQSFMLGNSSVEGAYFLDVFLPQYMVDECIEDASSNPFAVCALAAQQLDGVRITIEATDSSGKTISRSYVIHPVDDFKVRYAELKQRESEGEPDSSVSLFIMQEVS